MTSLEQLKQEKIAVLYGGDSAEREVSLNSGSAVAKGLTEAGFNVELIDTQGFNLGELKTRGIDRAFIALHGRGGEDGCIQGALEYLGVPYTGSNVLGSALAMDKIRCKQIWRTLGLPTAEFKMVEKADFNPEQAADILAALGGKVMVKPAHEGSSIGMASADSAESLIAALNNAFEYDSSVLVEAWITGGEYTVAILGQQALPAIHMETPHEFYDYQAKYQVSTTQYHCPSNLPKEQEAELQGLALQAFKSSGASGWGRVDFMLNSDNQWQLLEVNTVPGMTETSLVPKAAKVHGLTFNQLVTEILQLSANR
ncbi:D-alanine--D-alanine ligase [Endozoicomonas sp. G2_1]|uniref:D-alanine--D-alanine ligase n=1 Tax=Endozoicomonas sp. G2_1 TaxID=2821091 RepID=UPI001AD96F86|nr:D-alanine--D-alanine ligase [Endozoicomonas sp. G2_1]MBO9491063.1 D-alanine--D-alanine ligase [Endozoicomonas sp. G2_1]